MMPPAGTRIVAVTSALVTAFSAIDDVTVLYLVEGGREVRRDFISVAVGRSGVQVRRDKAPGLSNSYVENMRVNCKIRSWSGSKNAESRLIRCAEILDQVGAIVLADHTLGGACDNALLGPDDALSAADGPGVEIAFSILTKTST